MTYIADKALRLRYEFGRVRRDSAAKQIGLRRIRSILLLGNKDPEHAATLLREAEHYLLHARARDPGR
jgi:hypothetical protein